MRVSSIALCVLVSAACNYSAGEPLTSVTSFVAEDEGRLIGLVDVDVPENRDAHGDWGASLQAVFARSVGVSEQDLWSLMRGDAEAFTETGCVYSDEMLGDEAGGFAEALVDDAARVTLEHAGELKARVGEQVFEVPSRTYPAIGVVLGGVMYAGRAERPVENQAEVASSYRSIPVAVETRGHGTIEAFALSVKVPPPPSSIELVPDAEGGETSALVWTPGSARVGNRIRLAARDGDRTLYCFADDTGHAPIQSMGALWRLLERHGGDKCMPVKLSRQSLRSVSLPGFASFEVKSSSTSDACLSPQ